MSEFQDPDDVVKLCIRPNIDAWARFCEECDVTVKQKGLTPPNTACALCHKKIGDRNNALWNHVSNQKNRPPIKDFGHLDGSEKDRFEKDFNDPEFAKIRRMQTAIRDTRETEQVTAQPTTPTETPPENESDTVYFHNLNDTVREGRIYATFSQYGTIIDFKLYAIPGTTKSRGMGRVQFATKDMAMAAIANLDDRNYHGQNLRVKWFDKDAPRVNLPSGKRSPPDERDFQANKRIDRGTNQTPQWLCRYCRTENNEGKTLCRFCDTHFWCNFDWV
jgi:RNA recognition motif-containing protein